jgi:hypothetical protein
MAGTDGDVAEAVAVIERLASAPADDGLVIPHIWLSRLRAPLARAHGDDARCRECRDRHRDMVKALFHQLAVAAYRDSDDEIPARDLVAQLASRLAAEWLYGVSTTPIVGRVC